MRRPWTDALAAADLVAGRAQLWLPGALAWSLTIGWLPLVVAVGRAPSVADLTFLGARLYSSSAWPWNLAAAAFGLLLVAVAALVLAAVAETVLVGGGRRGLTLGGVARVTVAGVVAAAPAVAALLAGATAFVLVAIREFNLPGPTDPVLRSLWQVAPFGVAVALAWMAGAAVHAVTVRSVVLGRSGLIDALAGVPGRLRSAGAGGLTTAAATWVAGAAYAAAAAVLLAVLWDPIERRLAVDGIDATGAPLLVGFVAIWLCIVLGGGALHAWASVTWTRVLTGRDPAVEGAGRRTQGDPYRP